MNPAPVLLADASGFVRRECPHCARPFKVRACHVEGEVRRFLLRRVPHETDVCCEGRVWTCPYCGCPSEQDEYLSAAQQQALDAYAESIAHFLRYEQLSQVLRMLADNPRPTYVPVKPALRAAAMPGEPEDLQVVPLLCCGEELKIQNDWTRSMFCPFCGALHERGQRRAPSQERHA